jgi:hypothetical protein
MLPLGSQYMALTDPDYSWSFQDYRTADIIDLLNVINWRLAGCPEERTPITLTRPGDASRRETQRKKSQKIKRTIEDTKWEVV